VNKIHRFPYAWLVLVATATLGMFLLLGWHALNTFRASQELKEEYSDNILTASRLLSTHQRLMHEVHLIVLDEATDRIAVYREHEQQMLDSLALARENNKANPGLTRLLDSLQSMNRQLREVEHQALAALVAGRIDAAHDLLHHQSDRTLDWALQSKVSDYIEGMDRLFSERLDAEGRKELVSLAVAFVIFGLSVAAWLLLIQRLRSWGIALQDEMNQRREAEEQLRQAQKMEAMGQLAAGVSHDFNNILSVIQGFADIARSHSPEDSVAKKALEKVEVAARQGTELTQSLLTFSGGAGSEMEAVDLARLVAETTRMLDETLPATIHVRLDSRLPDKTGWLWGNAAQLRQVLVNLVLNARDAMPAGGDLTIVLEPEERSTEKESIRLTVGDNGTGMPTEVRERVFEPFFSTKPRGRGTGLGLAVALAIVEEHGGRIGVESTLGKGTRFQIVVPTLDPEDVPVDAEEKIAGRVLFSLGEGYVEDLVGSALTNAGFEIHRAESATDLTESMETGPWDVVLLDSGMPMWNDPRLVTELVKSVYRTHVIVIGQALPKSVERRLGPDILIVGKPFLINDLIRLTNHLTKDHAKKSEGKDTNRRRPRVSA
jgi:signal transduction histidine kinase